MSSTEVAGAPTAPLRDVPVDWEALEDAFENNAPEVHSYLHVVTGDVLRIVDGVADPQMHSRIAADTSYLRVDPVSSREQYRWMERYIPLVEEDELREKLARAIDGKGAFRRFKDVLMTYAQERERWFAFRSERLRIFMEAWLGAHAIAPIPRPTWTTDAATKTDEAAEGTTAPDVEGGVVFSTEPRLASPARAVEAVRSEAFRSDGARGDAARGEMGRGELGRGVESVRSIDMMRASLRDLAMTLGVRELESVCAFAEFLRIRRGARGASFAAGVGPRVEGNDSSEGAEVPSPPVVDPQASNDS